jgi:hypothetical protein
VKCMVTRNTLQVAQGDIRMYNIRTAPAQVTQQWCSFGRSVRTTGWPHLNTISRIWLADEPQRTSSSHASKRTITLFCTFGCSTIQVLGHAGIRSLDDGLCATVTTTLYSSRLLCVAGSRPAWPAVDLRQIGRCSSRKRHRNVQHTGTGTSIHK